MTDLDQALARAEAAEQERDDLADELERVRDILAAVIPNAIEDDTALDLAQQAAADRGALASEVGRLAMSEPTPAEIEAGGSLVAEHKRLTTSTPTTQGDGS